VSKIAFTGPQLHLVKMGQEIAQLYIEANHDDVEKLAVTRTLLRTISSPVIGLILGETIEMEIRDNLRSRGFCIQCGGHKDGFGKCPVCSK
jgi:hypothetical protein